MIIDAGGYKGDDARKNTEILPIRTKQCEGLLEAADELDFTLGKWQSPGERKQAPPVRDPATCKVLGIMLEAPWPFLSPPD